MILGGYVMLARSVIHLFPFSIFDMYADNGGATSGSRVVARGEDGRVTEVDRYRAWTCAGPIEPFEACARRGAYHIPYKDAEAVAYVEGHRGEDPAAVHVDLVRRVWWLSEDAAETRIEDCPIARCRAVAR